MKFFLDNRASPLLASLLSAQGHDAIHMRAMMPADSTDEAVFAQAEAMDRVLLAADADFGAILAIRGATRPSVVLFRRQRRTAADLREALVRALPVVEADLEAGAMVVVADTTVRIRRLPIV